jgi:transglutaminase-like putative cysteine protease
MRLHLYHQTTYQYSEPVPSGLQQLRLTPLSDSCQRVLDWRMTFEGATRQVDYLDHHQNRVVLIGLDGDGRHVAVRVEGEVETTDRSGVVGTHTGCAPLWLYLRQTQLTEPGDGVQDLIRGLDAGEGNTADVGLFHELAQRVADAVMYQGGSTSSESTAEESLAAGRGVCQDHAHVFISAARQLGVPARYVSGYLMMTETPDQAAGHAWAEVHLPALGWVGFDISNGICPDERYVRVATGLDYREAAPISGLRIGGGFEEMDVALRVVAGDSLPAPERPVGPIVTQVQQ